MTALGEADLHVAGHEIELPSCRDLLRVATQAPHERLHLHAGFSTVKDGTITRADYRALLSCLYGFYRSFEREVGVAPLRTQWLARDLAWLGVDAATLSGMPVCGDMPRYHGGERRLGALYVVEGSAMGGRVLCRGLDALLGSASVEGRRFFTGRGDASGDAWRGFLGRLAAVGAEPRGRAALLSAAIETFEVFERWLDGWRGSK
jgi:heme oxygenase